MGRGVRFDEVERVDVEPQPECGTFPVLKSANDAGIAPTKGFKMRRVRALITGADPVRLQILRRWQSHSRFLITDVPSRAHIPSEKRETLGDSGSRSEFRPSGFREAMKVAPIISKLDVNRIDMLGHAVQQRVAHTISLPRTIDLPTEAPR